MKRQQTQFIHLQTKNDGGITLALIYDQGLGVLHVGAAFCSPTEQQVNRKRGRQIAEGRLLARRHGSTQWHGKSTNAKSLLNNRIELMEIISRLGTRPHAIQTTGFMGPLWRKRFVDSITNELHQNIKGD